MIDRLSKRTAIAISAVGLLAVVLLSWFLFVSPQRSKAAELQGKIDESNTALQLARKISSPERTRSTAKETAVLVKAMPDAARMSQVLRQLSWASYVTRVRITSVTPAAAAPLSGYEAIPMTVVVEGHYPGITSFLGLLRKQVRTSGDTVQAKGRLYSVDQVQFDGSSDDGLLQATVMLNAYKFGGAAAPAANSAGTTSTPDASTGTTPSPDTVTTSTP
jgi:Tfp pilus assembly protein PilO